jgi:hypothetical protein
MLQRMPAAAVKDLCEWAPGTKPADYVDAVLLHAIATGSIVDHSCARISDDTPFNEYFFLRRIAHVPH